MWWMTSHRGDRRGNAAIEFALVLPVLLLLALPPIEFAWYITCSRTALEAVQDGARVGAKTPLSNDPVAAARAATLANLDASLPISYSPSDVGVSLVNGGDTVRVDVSIPFPPLIGFAPVPDRIEAFHQMRVERL